MPARRDQLPKWVINPKNSLEWNLMLARHGRAVLDNLNLLFFELLAFPSRSRKQQLHLMLFEYLDGVIKGRDTTAFNRVAKAFSEVVAHLQSKKLRNRTLALAIRFELSCRRRGERVTGKKLADWLHQKEIYIDEKYAQKLRRRFVPKKR